MQIDWVKEAPKQSRSQRTLDALLDAAEALLEDHHFAEVPVKGFTSRAGCSVGTFYTRFETKDDLLRALYARYAIESRNTLSVWSDPAAWEGVPLRDMVGALVQFIVADYQTRRGVRRAFDEALGRDPRLFAMMENLTEETIGGFARLLEARSEEHVHADSAGAAAFIHRIVFGVLDNDVRFDAYPGGHSLDADGMAQNLTATLRAWLGAQG